MTMSSNSQPPPPNPVLSAYEAFVRDTPLVTRYTLTTLTTSWVVSLFTDASLSLSTIPFFCVLKFEIYRIVLSPLLCQSALTLIFAYLCFLDNGKRLEFSMGSTAFGWFMLTLAFVTNTTFLCLMFLFYGMSGERGFLWNKSAGIWTVLFGIIATECIKAPATSQRRLFFLTVPTIYYPLALWAIFSLIGGVDFAELISVCTGYAYGRGYLDALKVGQSRLKRWEDTILVNFTRREGWVVGQAAVGDAVWTSGNATGMSMVGQESQQPGGDSMRWGGNVFGAQPPSDPAFPSTGGRPLGNGGDRAVRRPTSSDARAAILEAAERRAKPSPNDNGQDNNV